MSFADDLVQFEEYTSGEIAKLVRADALPLALF